MRKHRGIILVCCVACLVVATYIGFCMYFPAPPSAWLGIQRGQTQADMWQQHLVDPTAFIPIKSLDQSVAFSHSPIYGRVTHYLQVRYDDSLRVQEVTVDCETERFRLYRRRHQYL